MGNTNWKYIYGLAQEYNEKYKTLNLSNILYYKGVNLGQWLKTQRENYNKGVTI